MVSNDGSSMIWNYPAPLMGKKTQNMPQTFDFLVSHTEYLERLMMVIKDNQLWTIKSSETNLYP